GDDWMALAEVCRRRRPDLVVLDLGGDGRELYRRVRERAELVGVHVLALAAEPSRWVDHADVQSRLLEVIPRASMPEEIAARMQAAFAGHRLRDELESAEGIILEIAAAFDGRDP